jgi:hypothetical protein
VSPESITPISCVRQDTNNQFHLHRLWLWIELTR